MILDILTSLKGCERETHVAAAGRQPADGAVGVLSWSVCVCVCGSVLVRLCWSVLVCVCCSVFVGLCWSVLVCVGLCVALLPELKMWTNDDI